MNRKIRVANAVCRGLVEIFSAGTLLDIKVTISRVKMSDDLKIAFCYVLPFISNIKEDDFINSLEHVKSKVRSLLNSKVKLKFSPEIRFIYDNTYDYVDKIEKKIQEVVGK